MKHCFSSLFVANICFCITLETGNRPVPADLGDLQGSGQNSMTEIGVGSQPFGSWSGSQCGICKLPILHLNSSQGDLDHTVSTVKQTKDKSRDFVQPAGYLIPNLFFYLSMLWSNVLYTTTRVLDNRIRVILLHAVFCLLQGAPEDILSTPSTCFPSLASASLKHRCQGWCHISFLRQQHTGAVLQFQVRKLAISYLIFNLNFFLL